MSKHWSPLRYPGGKQKLTPFIVEIIRANDLVGAEYIEPYAGGAGVAMELLISGTASRVHINDNCARVAAFWRALVNYPDELCSLISRASLTVEEWRRQKAVFARPDECGELELGFSTLFLNRCNRSGILGGGLIGGLSQTGEWLMDARFPRPALIQRIEALAARSGSISVYKMDAEVFITDELRRIPHGLVYLDPPYFHKADRLYLNHYQASDHSRISKTIQKKLKHPWVVSYDNAPEIASFYSKFRKFQYGLQYNASRAYVGNELFIFSPDLAIPENSVLPGINAALPAARSANSGPFYT
jgi:DNA adenine methylase